MPRAYSRLFALLPQSQRQRTADGLSALAVKPIDVMAPADSAISAGVAAPARVAAVDVFRGLVMLILLPDLKGGWSFYQMAADHPDSSKWRWLATAFTHAQWTGMTVWDMVMPAFVFLVGVVMPFSVAARRRDGQSDARIYLHVILRSLALLLLGMILRMSLTTTWDELWPLLVLSAGLPVGDAVRRMPWLGRRTNPWIVELTWWGLVLMAATVHVLDNLPEIGNYDLLHVFSQLALSCVCAFPFVGRGVRVQLGAAGLILLGYAALFMLYPLPGPDFNPAHNGVQPTDQVFTGLFAHWNKNSNVAAVFDTWFLNKLPRAVPFVFNEYGGQTLNFIPTTATVLFGIMAGELLRSGRSRERIRAELLRWGAGGIVLGLLLGVTVIPIVKSLWTPSWTLLSTGGCALILAGFYQLCEIRRRPAWLFPLIVLGTNSILLYTLASDYRWWFLLRLQHVLGLDIGAGPAGPVAASAAFILMLWSVAYVLYRSRIMVRL